MTLGNILGFAAAALAALVPGIGSAIAVSRAGQAISGVCSEAPEKFSKLLVLQLLPATQGLYGFIIAFLIILKMGVLGGEITVLTNEQGWMYVVGALPIVIVGFFSALQQGKVAISGITLVGKKPQAQGSAITMTAVVEMYAIFGLIVSFFLVFLGL